VEERVILLFSLGEVIAKEKLRFLIASGFHFTVNYLWIFI